ncbi:SCO4226 family nickel-binding protein [Streptomyces sp. V4-01]|uniref:SCO4226 family nickel-binding protein n=1 Tax=Actinacidiphila polyblastidii TaxID=3110430 RepID=A0ABU7PCE2_9ACTN|nr:SCO4226 family nickel-binding protein [Streptomyces sp. V4-01]
MATFMDVRHHMDAITAEQPRSAHAADLANEGREGVRVERAWAGPDSGDVFCLSQAPSADAVQRVHERAGHAADEIHPVPYSA